MTSNFLCCEICLIVIMIITLVATQDVEGMCKQYRPSDGKNLVKGWVVFFDDKLEKPLVCVHKDNATLFDQGVRGQPNTLFVP